MNLLTRLRGGPNSGLRHTGVKVEPVPRPTWEPIIYSWYNGLDEPIPLFVEPLTLL